MVNTILSRKRITYFDEGFLEDFPWVAGKVEGKSVGKIKMYPTTDYVLPNLLKLLHTVSSGSKTFSEVYQKSGMRHKASFLKYLHFCEEMNFLGKNYHQNDERSNEYFLTESGRELLNLFRMEALN